MNALLRELHSERVWRNGAIDGAIDCAIDGAIAEVPHACYNTVPLLVLDLDGTLLESTSPGTRPGIPDYKIDGVFETRLRPGLGAFLVTVMSSLHYELVIFTAASAAYAVRMVDCIDHVVPGFRASLRCVFSREQVHFDLAGEAPLCRLRITKDLRSIARHCGRPLCRCLIVDDTPETYRLNASNALPVPVYDGSDSDRALDRLRDFLLSMPWQGVPLDVSGWPLGPRGAQPLLADNDGERATGGGCGLVRASSATCGREDPRIQRWASVPPAVLPAFLPLPDEAAPAISPAFLPPEDDEEIV